MPRIQVKDVIIDYSDTGSGKETIVFSHGLLFNKHMFDRQVEALSSDYRCIAYDHPGQGASSLPSGKFDMENLYEYAAAFLEILNPGPVHFVGLSMGGFVGMRLASRRPDLVKSLILLDTSADEEPYKRKYSLLNAIVRLFGTAPVARTVQGILFGKTFLHDPERGPERQHWKQHLLNLPRSITRSVDAVVGREGLFEEIRNIRLPVLIATGEEDVATIPEKAERIHSQIPGSQFKLIPKAGHSSAIEAPLAVNQALKGFLEQKSGPAA